MSHETRIGTEALLKNAALGSNNLIGRLGLDGPPWLERLTQIEAQITAHNIKTACLCSRGG